MAKSPVFIVGSPRSGTSILVKALTSAGYHGYSEGNFLPLLGIIHRVVDNHFAAFGKPKPKVLVAQVDRALLETRIDNIFKEMTDNLNPAHPWLDKSGHAEMIRAIPTLRLLWPNSVYLFAKRRAIENVVSRVKKFPAGDFERHCSGWGRTMAAWREIREVLPPGVFLEVDQQDLIRDTETISERISGLLQLDHEQARILIKTFKSRRPQETEQGSASKTYSLSSVGWSPTELEIFKKHCQAEMEAYGYGGGSDYYVKR